MSNLFLLLLRNTLASWIINVEFFGPIIIWIVASQKKERWPSLFRNIWLPICIWILAGLVKQLNMQLVAPYLLLNNDLILANTSDQIFLLLYAFLYMVSGILLIRLIYLKRRVSQ